MTLRVVCTTDGVDEIPALTGNLYAMAVPLQKGSATFSSLMIQENTAGKDGQEYQLNFQVQIPANASPHPIPPFTMPFLFYNGELTTPRYPPFTMPLLFCNVEFVTPRYPPFTMPLLFCNVEFVTPRYPPFTMPLFFCNGEFVTPPYPPPLRYARSLL